jgi:hypothetical protein
MKDGILTFSGMKFFINDTTMFDISNTNSVASPIAIPLMAVEVTPNAGHNPSNRTNTGFSFTNPFAKFFH